MVLKEYHGFLGFIVILRPGHLLLAVFNYYLCLSSLS